MPVVFLSPPCPGEEIKKVSNALICTLRSVLNLRSTLGQQQSFYHHTFSPNNVSGGKTLENGSLLLENVSDAAEASYFCEVSNGVGVDLSAVAYLNVQGTR